MKITDLPPLFLANMQHKYFAYPGRDKVKVVKLECIAPTDGLLDSIYWENGAKNVFYAYCDTANASRYYYEEYPVYKIFLPKLGARKYDPTRFKVLDTLILKKTDFNEKAIKYFTDKNSKDKNKKQHSEPIAEIHTGTLPCDLSFGVKNTIGGDISKG